jgi:hypothetical protein
MNTTVAAGARQHGALTGAVESGVIGARADI